MTPRFCDNDRAQPTVPPPVLLFYQWHAPHLSIRVHSPGYWEFYQKISVYNLPIEEALRRGFLVPYNYIPIYVHATEEEEEKFKAYNKKIASCYQNNKLINPDLLVKSLRGRLRVISMSEEKQAYIHEIIAPLKTSDHFVVYCGDGKLFDENTGEELRHI